MNPCFLIAEINLEPFLSYLPIAVGCAVALTVVVFYSGRRRKFTEISPPPPPPSSMPLSTVVAESERSEEWQIEEESFANRRGSVRREGAPVKVLVSCQSFRNGMETGYVLDRSTGGLRVALPKGLTPGSTMQVRAENAPDVTPWVTVIVRNCRNTGQHYELGCEFDKTPPWNVLLLFG